MRKINIEISLFKDELAAHQHSIDAAWGEAPFGVPADHVNHCLTMPRTALSLDSKDRVFIRNEKGKGYLFTENVELISDRSEGRNVFDWSKVEPVSKEKWTGFERVLSRSFLNYIYVLAG